MNLEGHMKTDFDTLKDLATHTIDHLVKDKCLEYPVDKRAHIIDKLATELGVGLSTEEDIIQQSIEEVEDKLGARNITDDITETEMFNHAKKEIIKSFNGESIGGLYMVESLHQIAERVKDHLIDDDSVEDVYGTDEELIRNLVKIIRGFSPKRTIQ